MHLRKQQTTATDPLAPVTRIIRSLIFLVTLLGGFLPANAGRASEPVLPSPSDEKAFLATLGKVRVLMEDAEWEKARDQLLSVLVDHAHMPYVFRRSADIREQFRRCTTKIAVPEPDPRDLISGKLVSYSSLRGVGQIHVRYTPRNLGDFTKTNNVLIHPLTFEGNYTVEITGPSYSRPPSIFVGMKGDEGYQVFFGYKQLELTRGWAGRKPTRKMTYKPATVTYIRGRNVEKIAKAEKPNVAAHKPFRLLVSVSDGGITARYNGRQVITCRKKGKGFGGFGIANFPAFDEIIIRGRANSSWLKGMVDKTAQNREKRYLKEADPEEGLPAWFIEGSNSGITQSSLSGKDLTQLLLAGVENPELVLQATKLLNEEKFSELISLLDPRDGDDALEPARSFFLLAAAMGTEDWERAVSLSNRLITEYPHISEFRSMRATVLSNQGSTTEAIKEYRKALSDSPKHGDTYVALTQLLMLEGQLSQAKKLLDKADLLDVRDPEIAKLRTQIVKAEFGPSFNRGVFREESPHYIVVTDIDRKAAKDALKHLEEVHKLCIKVLGETESRFLGKARVFLFSGQAGFDRYLAGFSVSEQHNRVGLYHPLLKQLLIWNVPDRNEMMATVRHEAVHQFADHLGLGLPVWLNEGLAEDLAIQSKNAVFRRPNRVEISGLYIRTLQREQKKRIPLRKLIRMGRGRFYGGGSFSYANAWAFIHYLRHGGDPEGEKIFLRLLEGSRKRMSLDQLIEFAFDGTSINALETKYRAFLRGLDQ